VSRLRLAVAVAAVLGLGACSSGSSSSSSTVAPRVTTTSSARGSTTTAAKGRTVLRAERTAWSLPGPRSREVAVVDRGSIVLAGGLDTADRSSASVWTIDPATGQATPSTPLVSAVHDAAGGLVGTRVLVFGGGAANVSGSVQSATGTPAVVGTLPRPLADIGTATVGRTTYVVGGFDGVHPRAEVLATEDGKTFRLIATLPHPARYPAVAASGGHLLVIGGETGAADSDAIDDVDLATGKLTVLGHLPAVRSHAVAVTLGGAVFVLGGRIANQPDAAILRVDPRTGAVTAAGSLPAGLRDAAVVAVGPNDAYLLGGARAAPVAEVVHLHLG
jgi:hypothetical protein